MKSMVLGQTYAACTTTRGTFEVAFNGYKQSDTRPIILAFDVANQVQIELDEGNICRRPAFLRDSGEALTWDEHLALEAGRVAHDLKNMVNSHVRGNLDREIAGVPAEDGCRLSAEGMKKHIVSHITVSRQETAIAALCGAIAYLRVGHREKASEAMKQLGIALCLAIMAVSMGCRTVETKTAKLSTPVLASKTQACSQDIVFGAGIDRDESQWLLCRYEAPSERMVCLKAPLCQLPSTVINQEQDL